ncbi:hypothetical protein SERLA73DRAFT_172732 [Serpula lacrymans var. lacrymans S7.3]|uniref:Myb-like domain-containing protein n=2 Tax=Serpula lacrymans var. lacrymans TaxID=341189 RepID=F8QGE4_SERL3|nr:uncharacterized protein SERLADRAFT_446154 [Serpula lacrymans var. lacrymans S7.9]EGN92622.1 hypothetical protein SERLA73DRAFT_172732 [Serpula lacrymans var. lacrymans S7.3]EGO28747.1 hypothetical protein SERLADRAFT_446154 [Serpula lacrymans var. lacrymans S7.9]
MSNKPDSSCKPPSAHTFSFTAPFPSSSASSSSPPTSSSLKQRRVSLALPSSPRLVPAWSFRDDTSLASHVAETSAMMPERKGKMRRIADDGERDEPRGVVIQEKKQRKKWTEEETQMLVDGCNAWGVGNWKAILKDPKLKFDNRSPVDLKDRFRTYFPDAYKEHYPNAKTHLSSKVRSTLPDGRSIFEKTRSKKRRPFTEEEDRALKAGYEKHGTVWATIVKDPVFQEQNRRSTDLRDRFRNAFPELYQAAGYKPRNTAKKKRDNGMQLPIRAATDDQLTMNHSMGGPTKKRRAQTRQGLYRGGTKSVPESATCSEDEDSSGAEEEDGHMFKLPSMPTQVYQFDDITSPSDGLAEMDMETIDPLSEPLSIPEYMPSGSQSLSELTDSSQSQAWSSLETPLHSTPWSATTGSPTSSHISSDYLLSHSPYNRRSDGMNMIGKSAWGTQDWFSANPRLDASAVSSSGSSFADGLSPAPSSPFSFHHLNHGVLDRYDLFPAAFAHDFASEAGMGDSHSTFSDPEMFAPTSFRGFTHHSNYAGDLIFGARTHQPPQQSFYGPGFGFGTPGLGLSGMQQSTGIHPMQLHTPALPGIDEIELASITLNDQADVSHDAMDGSMDVGVQKDEPEGSLGLGPLDLFNIPSQNLDDIVDLAHELHSTPPATPLTTSRHMRTHSGMFPTSSHGRSISVPPSAEPRSTTSRPTQVHVGCQPQITGTRSLPLFEPLPPQLAEPTYHHAHTHSEDPASFDAESWRSSNHHFYGLPFLDLHYYSSNANNGGNVEVDYDFNAPKMAPDNSRQGQALDLARSTSSTKNVGYAYATVSQALGMPQTSVATGSRPHHATHHRGQSVVSPQELQVRKSSDNKRKRASWDGGIF